ncbi:type II toxin-antitoxin system VapC family toxin [Agrobacterium tumefaciens]|uniref:type II toxin-antitoxin system VapC family toxin n=1 Tax=Rhizobiaceae TaxID=82115 RepID=UPI000DD841AF|nr:MULTISPECIES: type II toxin-antitoxin system VapC family toxin [Hyphomicrobiales]MDG4672890.1 type II toxin-antitoxin system VapC family toxin [Shinella sp. 838]MDX3928057.1 type II toxin-antitoxin system VapC family toxin [Shinella sp.]WKL22200.1 type II toxin-antitoxin system VapC family toxin [Agrobacterium tumefaciens]
MTFRLLDTNAVISLVARRSEPLLQRVETSEPGSLAVSSVVAHELYFGAYRSERVAYNLETLRLLFTDLAILDFDREDARVAGEIRAELKRRGTPIGPYDTLIAGQAKARGLTLVTNNTGEFSRIAGLRIEDWTTNR